MLDVHGYTTTSHGTTQESRALKLYAELNTMVILDKEGW